MSNILIEIQVFRSFLERTNDIENLTCDIYFAYPDTYSLNAIGKQVMKLLIVVALNSFEKNLHFKE
jgi:hypothetical protein